MITNVFRLFCEEGRVKPKGILFALRYIFAKEFIDIGWDTPYNRTILVEFVFA